MAGDARKKAEGAWTTKLSRVVPVEPESSPPALGAEPAAPSKPLAPVAAWAAPSEAELCGGGGRGRRIERADLVAFLDRKRHRRTSCAALPATLLGCALIACNLVMHSRPRVRFEATAAVHAGLGLQGAAPEPALREWLQRMQGSPASSSAKVVGGVQVSPLGVGDISSGHRAAPAACGSYTAWDFVIGSISAGGTPSAALRPSGCRSKAAAAQAWRSWALRPGVDHEAAANVTSEGLSVGFVTWNPGRNFSCSSPWRARTPRPAPP